MTAHTNITPASRQYGFAHLRDPLIPYTTRTVPNWQALGLAAFGVAVSVDGNQPLYNGTRRLFTNADPAAFPSLSPTHNVTVADVSTPKTTDGSPLFSLVWEYLAFPVN